MAVSQLFLAQDRGTYTKESQLHDYPFIEDACVGKFRFRHEGHDHTFTCIQLFPCEHIHKLNEIRALLKQSARLGNVFIHCCKKHHLNLSVAKAKGHQQSRIVERCDVEMDLDLKPEWESIITHDAHKEEKRERKRLEKELQLFYLKSSCKVALLVFTTGMLVVIAVKAP